MNDTLKTKAELIEHVRKLRKKIDSLEVSGPDLEISANVVKDLEKLADSLSHLLKEEENKNISNIDEEYSRSLLNCMQDDLFVINKDYKITDTNKNFINTADTNRLDIIGQHCHKISHGYDIPCIEMGKKCLLPKVFETGQPESYRHEHLGSDGSLVWVDVILSPLKNKKGEVTHIIKTERDISALMEVWDALRESVLRYLILFESAQEAILLIKGEEIIDCNAATEKFFFCDRTKIIGTSIFEFIPEIQPDGIDSKKKGTEYTRLAVSGKNQRFEWEFRAKNHIEMNVDISLSRVKIGGESNLLVTIWDISSQKQVQSILDSQRSRLASIFDGSPIPTLMINTDHKIEIWNRASESLTGISRDNVLDKPVDLEGLFKIKGSACLADLILDMDDNEILTRYGETGIRKNMTHREAFETTASIWSGNSLRKLIILATRIRDSQGNIVGAIQCAQDITEKEALQKRLLHAQKMEAIGTMAGGIAHDFNNLLQTVQGYADLLLLDKKAEEEGFFEAGEIKRATKRAAELTNQLLTFSRKMESRLHYINLNYEMLQIEKLFKRSIPANIRIELDLADKLYGIYADAAQVEQMMMILSINARDSMPEGGKIIIKTQNVIIDEAFCLKHPWISLGEYVLLCVSDTGIGIDLATQERIFEPFFTTKQTATGKGTGLGLAMVYGIVKNNNGYITCQSKSGKGTVFEIYLPAAVEKKNEKKLKEASVEYNGKEVTILLVDDEKALRNFGKQILDRAGYKVITVEDGESALEYYRQHHDATDLIILDLIMPGIGGRECLDELLRINPEQKIIVTSGYFGDRPVRQVIGDKAVAFLSKPFEAFELLSLINEVLEQEQCRI